MGFLEIRVDHGRVHVTARYAKSIVKIKHVYIFTQKASFHPTTQIRKHGSMNREASRLLYSCISSLSSSSQHIRIVIALSNSAYPTEYLLHTQHSDMPPHREPPSHNRVESNTLGKNRQHQVAGGSEENLAEPLVEQRQKRDKRLQALLQRQVDRDLKQ